MSPRSLSSAFPQLTAAFASVCLAAGCNATGGTTSADDISRDAVAESERAGIHQRVTVSPAVVRQGDSVTVRSVLRTTGSDTIPVHYVVCGLDYSGTLRLGDNGIRCVAYSVHSHIAPGDSVVAVDRRPVVASPGRWQLRVQHALNVGLETAVEIEVVSR